MKEERQVEIARNLANHTFFLWTILCFVSSLLAKYTHCNAREWIGMEMLLVRREEAKKTVCRHFDADFSCFQCLALLWGVLAVFWAASGHHGNIFFGGYVLSPTLRWVNT